MAGAALAPRGPASALGALLRALPRSRGAAALLFAAACAVLARLLQQLLARRAQLRGTVPSDDSEADDLGSSEGLPSPQSGVLTMAEVKRHTSEDDCWFVYNGAVYDVTHYLKEHPGGAQACLNVAGTDATQDFDEIGHSDAAMRELEGLCIGRLGQPRSMPVVKALPEPAPPTDVVLRGKGRKTPLRLAEREEVSRNVRRLRFALPEPSQRLGLPVGKHVLLSYTDAAGETVSRAYTPATGDEVTGYVDIVIKVYFANEHPKFPHGGRMSQYLDSLAVGDAVDFSGPVGQIEYLGRGRLSRGGDLRAVERVNMIAGGTGITPMLQMIDAVLRDAGDAVQLRLIFANQTPDDVFLRDVIDRRAADPRLRRWYTVDRAGDGWGFGTGFVDDAMCCEHLFPPSERTVTLLCGPPPMLKFACKPSLSRLGYSDADVFSF